MTHTGHAWAATATPGRCQEGVTPGSAGIFSALSYFVAETPIMLIGNTVPDCFKLIFLLRALGYSLQLILTTDRAIEIWVSGLGSAIKVIF